MWAAASIWSADGGGLHFEAQTYLPYHLSGAPLVQRLFNSRILDQGMYQARELSYLFDALDCRFIALSTRFGVPHFLSLTYYVSAIAIALLLWRFFTGQLAIDGIVSAALILIFLTSPMVFLSGGYFRSSKILVCLIWALLIPHLYRTLRRGRAGWRDGVWLGALGLAGTLADRQGFYLLACLAAFLAAYWLRRRGRAALFTLAATAAACLLALAYNYQIAPRLTLALSGYWPSFWYQRLPWQRFGATPLAYVAVGTRLFLGSAAFLFGNLPALAAAIPLAALIWMLHAKYGAFWAATAAAGLVSLAAMNTMMVLRHGALVWPDMQRAYYWLPQVLLLIFLAAFAVAGERTGRRVRVLRAVLFVALAANLVCLPGHRTIVGTVHELGRGALGHAVRRALVTGHASPEIAANPVYRALRPYVMKSRDTPAAHAPQ